MESSRLMMCIKPGAHTHSTKYKWWTISCLLSASKMCLYSLPGIVTEMFDQTFIMLPKFWKLAHVTQYILLYTSKGHSAFLQKKILERQADMWLASPISYHHKSRFCAQRTESSVEISLSRRVMWTAARAKNWTSTTSMADINNQYGSVDTHTHMHINPAPYAITLSKYMDTRILTTTDIKMCTVICLGDFPLIQCINKQHTMIWAIYNVLQIIRQPINCATCP